MITAKNLIASVREVIDHEEGRVTLETQEIYVPEISVKETRQALKLSQRDFSRTYSLPISTIRNWEQGLRKPEGAARILLNLIAQKPSLVAEEIKKMKMALKSKATA
jgi:putative transcriptional regulator